MAGEAHTAKFALSTLHSTTLDSEVVKVNIAAPTMLVEGGALVKTMAGDVVSLVQVTLVALDNVPSKDSTRAQIQARVHQSEQYF